MGLAHEETQSIFCQNTGKLRAKLYSYLHTVSAQGLEKRLLTRSRSSISVLCKQLLFWLSCDITDYILKYTLSLSFPIELFMLDFIL